VPADTINEISQAALSHFAAFQNNAVDTQLSFDAIKLLMHKINDELNGLNSTLSQSHAELEQQKQINDVKYLASIFVVNTMVSDVESQILAAINGMVI